MFIVKPIGTEWMRLHLEREKNPLISLDPDNIYKRDWIMDSLKNRGNYVGYSFIYIEDTLCMDTQMLSYKQKFVSLQKRKVSQSTNVGII